jgi:hypothetical protein
MKNKVVLLVFLSVSIPPKPKYFICSKFGVSIKSGEDQHGGKVNIDCPALLCYKPKRGTAATSYPHYYY